MITYQPLTKIATDEKGNQMVDCLLHGTEECQNIHMPNGCRNCPIFVAILKQLNTFEEIYLQEDEENDRLNE